MRLSINRNLTLLHSFKQCRLSFWRSSIYLISKKQVREDRPVPKSESGGAHIENIGPGDVCGHEVGRKLNTSEIGTDRTSKHFYQQGFCSARNAFDQSMSFGEQRYENLLDHLVLSDDGLGYLALQVGNGCTNRLRQ